MGYAVHGSLPVERYQLEGLWCMHLYEYIGELWIDGTTFPIRPGYISITPPDARLEYHYLGRSEHLYAHFSFSSRPTGQSTISILAMQDLEDEFRPLQSDFTHAVVSWPTRPARATARLWDILWQISERTPVISTAQPSVHPAVEQVIQMIELRIGERIYISDLAREVGLSHNHLARLFQTSLGCTISGYIQKRRINRAHHLLTTSTRSIKSIAIEVGISDLHLFNKTIHRAFGISPTQLRHQQATTQL
ncbi:hypothetical protein KDH_18170 [Dictyobacter sp. S3.2.2.5]|uniref:HTH araC/xylS-type domain-containing protein n=2 Tax=Dictyobacter halimunensis TaxID=3026934 RepID=A0ABQ6FL32_9CHLR|nr:hypothetical protein KDH_18170 [Dictyobacter sp. S3.2.2.5]